MHSLTLIFKSVCVIAITVARVQPLLKTLIFLPTVILVFVVALHVGTFSHGQYTEGDIRYQKLKAAELGLPLNDKSVLGTGTLATAAGPISNQLMTLGYIAEAVLLSSLFLGLAAYISLDLSGAREDGAVFNNWLRFFGVLIALAYVCLIAGVFLFLYQIHKSVVLTYPHYYSETNGINKNMKWDAASESFGKQDYVLHSVNDGVFWYNCTVTGCAVSILVTVFAHSLTVYMNHHVK